EHGTCARWCRMTSTTHTSAVRAGTGTPKSRVRLRRSRYRGGAKQVTLWVVLPGLAISIAIHLLAPVLGGAYAFTDWNGYGKATWVGLQNFKEIFETAATRNALFHTLKLSAVFVVVVNVAGLALALGLNRLLKTRNLLRSVFFF